MALGRRAFLGSAVAAAALPAPLLARPGGTLKPEDFGARGDGTTNDTRAFAALSEAINRRGGGTILLRRRATYVVGAQQRGGGAYGWNPAPIIDLRGLAGPLLIIGNGARLRCAAGLRFGTFDPGTGAAVHRKSPNYKIEELASPYRAMIAVHGCRGPIEIKDVELDGNFARLVRGGRFGDTGWQVPADGLSLKDNHSTELIVNVYSHHHGRDGALIDGAEQRSARSRFTRFVARFNGRQGASITGGRNYDFEDCEFSHTGRAGIVSAPAAGVDIEAEGGKAVRDLRFTRCKFLDNAGVGLLAEAGPADGARFDDCLFVGTTTWSAWPRKPHFSFSGCTFVGAVVHAFPDPDPSRAARFTDCLFTDDPKLSPTGKVFDGGGPIVNLGESQNVLFDRCRFNLVASAVLPWSWRATYRDCVMKQRSPRTAMTKGRFLGSTTIQGAVDLYGSKVEGSLVVNGRAIPRGIHGGKPW